MFFRQPLLKISFTPRGRQFSYRGFSPSINLFLSEESFFSEYPESFQAGKPIPAGSYLLPVRLGVFRQSVLYEPEIKCTLCFSTGPYGMAYFY